MNPLDLPAMTPAQHEGWQLLMDINDGEVADCCLIGGQMVWLLSAEYGADPLRATEDMDVVVNVRSDPGGIRRLCAWLESRGLQLEGVSSDGIGHLYSKVCDAGSGRVIFDVLAPDNVGARADLTTTPPARTLEAPGASVALNQAAWVPVSSGGRVGKVCRPSLTAALFIKAAATNIPMRKNRERDWSDAAFLLSLVPDPILAASELTARDRSRLRPLSRLLDEADPAWRVLRPDRMRLGHATLVFLMS